MGGDYNSIYLPFFYYIKRLTLFSRGGSDSFRRALTVSPRSPFYMFLALEVRSPEDSGAGGVRLCRRGSSSASGERSI